MQRTPTITFLEGQFMMMFIGLVCCCRLCLQAPLAARIQSQCCHAATQPSSTIFRACSGRARLQWFLIHVGRLEEDMGLQLASEADSLKYFPASNSSREVRDRMLAACQRLGVCVQCRAQVTGLSRDAESAEWRLRLEDGSEHCSARIASPCSQAERRLCMLCMLWSPHARWLPSRT